MVGRGGVRLGAGFAGTGLRHAEIVHPDHRLRQPRLPLIAARDQLGGVVILELGVGSYLGVALHEEAEDALERGELDAGRVGVLERGPLVRDEEHLAPVRDALVCRQVDELALGEQILVRPEFGELEQMLDRERVKGIRFRHDRLERLAHAHDAADVARGPARSHGRRHDLDFWP